jgi:integrase/recombinase XerC
VAGSRHGALPPQYADVYDRYTAGLRRQGLDPDTGRNYGSRVRSYLNWLGSAPVTGPDPLVVPEGRNEAVDKYVQYLETARNLSPRTVSAHLTALYSFLDFLGVGSVRVRRGGLTDGGRLSPRPLGASEQRRWLHAVQGRPLARDRVIALLLLYTGMRVSELIALNVSDVQGEDPVTGLLPGGGAGREIPLRDPQLQADLSTWLAERARWPQAEDGALILNRRGTRLSGRAVGQLLDGLAEAAGLVREDGRPDVPAQRLRDTFLAPGQRPAELPAAVPR